MLFALLRRLASGAVVVALAGSVACGANDDPPGTPHAPGAGISFDDGDVLRLVPGETREVGVTVHGEDGTVTLMLEGEYSDASLVADVVTSVDHRAVFQLKAPSSAALFGLRARLRDHEARLNVSVSLGGYASLSIRPTYVGKRDAPEVFASVVLQGTCSEITKGPVQDGAGVKVGPLGAPIEVNDVPAGMPVAVLARIKHYAAGCAEVPLLHPDTTRETSVTIFDRPMALDLTNLDTVFTFALDNAQTAAWNAMLDAAAVEVANAFLPETSAEGKALLDEIRELLPLDVSRTQFDTFRSKDAWDVTANAWLAERSPGLRARALAWLTGGKALDLGALVGHLSPGPRPHEEAILDLQTFASFPASDAGLFVRAPFGWRATLSPSDSVLLSGIVYLWPSMLVSRGADARAGEVVNGAKTVPEALAELMDCDGFAEGILGKGGVAYSGCDTACFANLCRDALRVMWDRGSTISIEKDADLEIVMNASAPAQVGDHAEPLSFEGTWLGTLSTSPKKIGLQGIAKGTYKEVP